MSITRPLWRHSGRTAGVVRLRSPLQSPSPLLNQRHTFSTLFSPPQKPSASKDPSPPQNAPKRTPPIRQGSWETNDLMVQDMMENESSNSQQPRNELAMAAKLDPRPRTRRRWETNMVIKSIRRRGRLSKTEIIKRTERESVSTSGLWQTSMKKLAPLARQIAGKTLADAMIQMEFSKKKMSKPILSHLQEAQLKAIVERGMGIPVEPDAKVKPSSVWKQKPFPAPSASDQTEQGPESQHPKVEIVDEEAEAAAELAKKNSEFEKENASQKETSEEDAAHAALLERLRPYRRITLKDGSHHTVWDPSNIYVAQAWVNKGPYGESSMGRARGRIDRLRLPQTSISVLLKEEATRIREHDVRQERLAKKKPWVQLPNRVIHGERPYYSW